MLTIGQLAQLTGVAASTLRYYERRGLIDPAPRVGGQRRYDPSIIGRLMVVKFCAFAGVPLDDIAVILNDESAGRAASHALAVQHVARIDAELAELRLARDMMDAASGCACASPERCECGAMAPVIGRLRDHLNATRGAPRTGEHIHVVDAM